MKIKKIKRIKNFATFNDFKWSSCQEFSKYNFFYGWNYSGKTTLSRIFRCLETKIKHNDFPDVEFSIETDGASITQQDISKDYPIRSFNEEFVEENFQWNNEDAEIEPVFIMGKEIKDLDTKVKEIMENKREKEESFKKIEKEKEAIEQNLDNFLTNKASEIRNILRITNAREFDKNKLDEKINVINDSYAKYILVDNEKEKKLNIYGSKKGENITFEAPQLRLSKYISEVKGILSQKIGAQQIIKKLKANPELSDWVREGIELHQKEEVCQFCGNLLPRDLFDRLKRHFSKEFDNLMQKINSEENEILGYIKEVGKINFPDGARLFENLQKGFENELNCLNTLISTYVDRLQSLREELRRKRENPFDSLELKKILDNTSELENTIRNIEKIINEHNLKVDSFESDKQKVREELIVCFTAEFIKEKNYIKEKEKIKKLKDNIENLNLKIRDLGDEIENINKQIKTEAIGADRINRYLEKFFCNNNLKVKLIDNGKYKLYRNDRIAKNLSTGEKNIISLIYFFAKLEETNFDFNNAVIFIDDPVSSLDSNHIFKVYAFINEKLKNCGQLFITTHNFDFFNLLKDLNKYDLENKGKFYLIKKIINNTGELSCIENLPNVLLKYKSEYNYLFFILKSFNELNDKSKFDLLYLLPNILRRFFEAYLYMKYPDGKRFKTKANTFLKDSNLNDKQSTLKLIDEYSHEQNPTHSQKFPDIEEVINSANFILESIKNKDKEHYEALCESLINNCN